MITADEYKFELLNAYNDLGTALDAIAAGYGALDEKGDLLPGAIDALLLFLPDAARDIRAATQTFNEKIADLQRRSFQVLQGGRR
jgi:hypothetical protein